MKRKITTNLVEREEIFKLLALAEAVSLPVLLVGPPGTGKTNTLLDFAKAVYPKHEDLMAQSFILETDEGTRSSEVKGKVDVKKLVTENEYAVIAPITNAKFILINEIDKASSALRNAFLGIMNEKVLMQGHEQVLCEWTVFCAAVNEIPKEEVGNPFWDRFVLKRTLSRISKSQMLKYYDSLANGKQITELDIVIPTQDEIKAKSATIPREKLEIFVDLCHDKLSDRTLSYVPRLVGAAALVWECSITKAMVKVCDLLAGWDIAKKLSSSIEPKELVDLRSKIEVIVTLDDFDQIANQIKIIQSGMEAAVKKGIITAEDSAELKAETKAAVNKNPIYSQRITEQTNG